MTEEIRANIDKIATAYWVYRDARITKWEGEFATDMSKRIERFGDKTFVSDKQAAVIAKIAAKLA